MPKHTELVQVRILQTLDCEGAPIVRWVNADVAEQMIKEGVAVRYHPTIFDSQTREEGMPWFTETR